MTAVLGPPTIASIVPSGGNVTINFQSFPGRNYRVQYKTNLLDVGWSDLAGDVNTSSFSGSKLVSIVGDNQFFRVKLLTP